MKKLFFLVLMISFSLDFFANQPKPTLLPTFPERKEAILRQKEKTKKQREIIEVVVVLPVCSRNSNGIFKTLSKFS